MSEFKFNKHPHELFEKWYLASMGLAGNQSYFEKLKIRTNHLLKNVFTQFVPSLDRMNNNAFVLATAGAQGVPTSRVVLLKEYSEQGYVFYTNYNSNKSKDILENPMASMNFFWSYPTRQVRIVGSVEKVSYETSQKYWQSRPRGSQEGALASDQSKVLTGFAQLDEQLQKVKRAYQDKEIPCPKHWGGFMIKPKSYEFWMAMPNRLHRRVRCTKNGQVWKRELLAP